MVVINSDRSLLNLGKVQEEQYNYSPLLLELMIVLTIDEAYLRLFYTFFYVVTCIKKHYSLKISKYTT